MSWWRSLVARLRRRTSSQSTPTGESIQLRGVVQSLDTLRSPLSGEECVSIRLLTSVPAAFGSIVGGITRHQQECRQSVEFLLRDGQGGVLVRIDPGSNVSRFHARLVERHGLGLECEEELVCDGDVVDVEGQVMEVVRGAPHRRAPYRAVVWAQRLAPVS